MPYEYALDSGTFFASAGLKPFSLTRGACMGLISRLASICVISVGLGLSSANAFVIGPTTPGKFGSPVFGTGAAITYSYMPTGTNCAAEATGCTITHLGGFMP